MRAIFLDFDGVLNGSRYLAYREKFQLCDHMKWFNPDCVLLLSKLVLEARGRIVVTSDLRRGRSKRELSDLLYDAGLNRKLKVAGTTPEHGVSGQGLIPELPELTRGDEIMEWLASRSRKLKRFAVLDSMCFRGLEGHMVKVDPAMGLTRADVESAVRILQR